MVRGYDVIGLTAKEYQPSQTGFRARLVRMPIDDRLDPSTEELMWAFLTGRQLAGAVADGKKVLVSCRMGKNRSGLVTALAARELLGITGQQAADLVRESRPGALSNPTFYRFLTTLPRAP
jgi:protein-tyrosine phosphatase